MQMIWAILSPKHMQRLCNSWTFVHGRVVCTALPSYKVNITKSVRSKSETAETVATCIVNGKQWRGFKILQDPMHFNFPSASSATPPLAGLVHLSRGEDSWGNAWKNGWETLFHELLSFANWAVSAWPQRILSGRDFWTETCLVPDMARLVAYNLPGLGSPTANGTLWPHRVSSSLGTIASPVDPHTQSRTATLLCSYKGKEPPANMQMKHDETWWNLGSCPILNAAWARRSWRVPAVDFVPTW